MGLDIRTVQAVASKARQGYIKEVEPSNHICSPISDISPERCWDKEMLPFSARSAVHSLLRTASCQGLVQGGKAALETHLYCQTPLM